MAANTRIAGANTFAALRLSCSPVSLPLCSRILPRGISSYTVTSTTPHRTPLRCALASSKSQPSSRPYSAFTKTNFSRDNDSEPPTIVPPKAPTHQPKLLEKQGIPWKPVMFEPPAKYYDLHYDRVLQVPESVPVPSSEKVKAAYDRVEALLAGKEEAVRQYGVPNEKLRKLAFESAFGGTVKTLQEVREEVHARLRRQEELAPAWEKRLKNRAWGYRLKLKAKHRRRLQTKLDKRDRLHNF